MIRFGCFSILLLLALHQVVAAQQTVPQPTDGIGIDQRLGETIPLETCFVNEDGKIVPLSDYFQRKPVILVLAYYRCPMLCNLVLNGLFEGLRGVSFEAGRDYQVVIVSIDPRENPNIARAKKSTYAEEYGMATSTDGWHFLCGKQESIDRLAQAAGFRFRYVPEQDQYAHASGIMILSPEGRISRYLYGIRYPSRDLRLSLVEAADNKIGTAADQLLLLCFHYDANTGKYTAAVMTLIRLMGLVTLAALSGLLILLWKRSASSTALAR